MTFYKSPTYDIDSQTWTYTEFDTRKSVALYIRNQVKYPGEYNLKYTQGFWNEQAEIYRKNKHYPKYVNNSIDFIKHWDFEKEKCKFNGFIIYKKPSENIEFAIPGLFYWYLNYCPIPDKMKAALDFSEIWDGDYHYFIYILLCIIERKFGAVLKARQKGYTLKNMAIMLNCIWFGEAAVAKIFAQEESKVKDSWGFMEIYRDHINEHCGWKRGFDPSKKLDWQIRRKRVDGSYVGNMSLAKGFTTKQDATNGIGGSAAVIYGEESGANSTLGLTHEFITSNVAMGGLTTGLIIYSGAVGELDKAEALKDFIINPEDNGFLSCINNIPDDLEFGEKVGFFAPEWWNYVSVDEDDEGNQFGEVLKCYDVDGNTNKALAMIEIVKHRKKAENKSPEKFRYYCSQRPLSIKEAFAHRKESTFPLNLIAKHKQRIEDKKYPHEFLDIGLDDNGQITFKKTHRFPIREFPLSKVSTDKEGCVVVWERPCDRPAFGMYYASIDPLKVGKTVTSLSLFCIYIYKNDVEVTKISNGETETYIEPGKIVATWVGRFDDINNTNKIAQYLVEIYNAWTLVEANAYEFVTHMINVKKHHYLVPKGQIMFLKELSSNLTSFQDYGWKNTGNPSLFQKHMIPYLIGFLKEEIDAETKPNGEKVKITYGIERIPDLMAMKEMELYNPGINVDRLIALASLVTFVKIQNANRGYLKRVEKDEGVKSDKNLYKLEKSFFKTRTSSQDTQYSLKKTGFKNLK